MRPTNGLPPLTGEFLYVSNDGDGLISEYSVNTATGALTSVGTFNSMVPFPEDLWLMAVHPTNEFIYAADENDDVRGFDIGDGGFSGLIFARNSIAPAVNGPRAVAITPNGGFLYATNSGGTDALVSEYSINLKTGALTPIGTAHTGQIPFGVAVESTGRYAYIVNLFDESVSQYLVQPSGTLLPNGTIFLPLADSPQPELIATVPPANAESPTCAYVTDDAFGALHEFQIMTATALLSYVGNVSAKGLPFGIAVHPNGQFVYTANPKSNSLSVFTKSLDAPACTVTLTSQVTSSPAEVSPISDPISITVEPTGKYAYVANFGNGTVGEFSIDATTGALAPIGEVNTETPPNPGSLPISVVTTH